MGRIAFLTDRSLLDALPAIQSLGLDVKTEPLAADSVAHLPELEPSVLMADAEGDPGHTFQLLGALPPSLAGVPVVVVVARSDLETLPWATVADELLFSSTPPAELRVRLAMLDRRSVGGGDSVLRLGPLSLDTDGYRALVTGRPLDLTYKEFELLKYLMLHPDRVSTRSELLQNVWGYNFYGGTRTVDVHIRRLRAKLGPEHEDLIQTVRGVGYAAGLPRRPYCPITRPSWTSGYSTVSTIREGIEMHLRWLRSACPPVALLASICLLGGSVASASPQAKVKQFAIPTLDSRPYSITSGPDGNLYFTESDGDKIGRITPTGKIHEFDLPHPDSEPYGITLGPDGNLWFTERFGNRIGRMTTSHEFTEYVVPTPDAQPWDITALPDGTFWFTEENVDQLGVLDQQGVITEYPLTPGVFPTSIATGPDGNVWFTEEIGNAIGRLNPADPSKIKLFTVPTEQSLPWDISPGPDGKLWFTELAGRNIGRITTRGHIREFPVPGELGIAGITAASDGRMWFTENDTSKVGSITLRGHVRKIYDTGSYPFGISGGPDGNVWFCVGLGNAIGRVRLS